MDKNTIEKLVTCGTTVNELLEDYHPKTIKKDIICDRYYSQSEISEITDYFDWTPDVKEYSGYLRTIVQPCYLLPDTIPRVVDSSGRMVETDSADNIRNIDGIHEVETGPSHALYFDWKALTKNYAHFYNDFLGTLYLIDRLGFRDVPLLVPAHIVLWTVFQQIYRKCPEIADFNWVILPWTHAVGVEKLWILHYHAHMQQESLECTLNWLKVKYNIRNLNSPIEANNVRIFLDRSNDDGRNLINKESIQMVLDRYGFKTVTMDNLSIAEQRALFTRVKYLVGIHGAGIVNMIYRGNNQLSLLELIPSDMSWTKWFSYVAQLMGFSYTKLIGPVEPRSDLKPTFKPFSVNPETFEEILIEMLSMA